MSACSPAPEVTMTDPFTRRAIRAAALVLLTLSATLAGTGCGKDGGDIPTDPIPTVPEPTDPGPEDPAPTPQGPAPVGDVMYAVDLSNNFIVFGSGSISTLSAKMRITGLPILKRVIGLAIRPADGAVIAVGNDSRVYTIDPLTAHATPVSGAPFSPEIAEFFDIHFAMALEPNGTRVRLIAAESGGNWSIDINDGTAYLAENARYGTGSELEGQTARLLGLVYPTLPDSAKQPGWCENLAYALDADEAVMLASCDPDSGQWWPTGVTPEASATRVATTAYPLASSTGSPDQVLRDLKDQLMRCGEFMPGPDGASSDGEQEPPADGGPWFPRSPDTDFWVMLRKVGEAQSRVGTVERIDAQEWGITWLGDLPAEDPEQTGVWAVGGPYGPSPSNVRRQLTAKVRLSADEMSVGSDPRARCS
jgi:hypothetical protein